MVDRAASSPARGRDERPGDEAHRKTVLEAKVEIADALEDTAHFEGPWDGFLAAEEITHLHDISQNPGCNDRDAEALAGPGAVIRHDLRKGQHSLNGKTDRTQSADIGFGIGEGREVEDEEGARKVGEEQPVSMERMIGQPLRAQASSNPVQKNLRLGVPPLPKVIRPLEVIGRATGEGCMLNAVSRAHGRSIVQSHLEQRNLHQDHH